MTIVRYIVRNTVENASIAYAMDMNNHLLTCNRCPFRKSRDVNDEKHSFLARDSARHQKTNHDDEWSGMSILTWSLLIAVMDSFNRRIQKPCISLICSTLVFLTSCYSMFVLIRIRAPTSMPSALSKIEFPS